MTAPLSKRQVLFGAALAIAVWASHFCRMAEFGLYEDDYWRIPPAMEAGWRDLWTSLTDFVAKYGHTQGRPLHDGLIQLFAWVGARLAGMQGMFVLAFVIVAANAVLFLVFLRRAELPEHIAAPAALAFALFPADTTQAFLTHSFGIQPSLGLLLLGGILYLSGRRKLAHFVAAGSLFCYETVYPLWLGVPLLEREWSGRWRRRLVVHGLIFTLVVGGTVLLRSLAGEGRVHLLRSEMVRQRLLNNIVDGPVVALTSYWRKFRSGIDGLDAGGWWVAALAAVAFVVVLSVVQLPPLPGEEKCEADVRPRRKKKRKKKRAEPETRSHAERRKIPLALQAAQSRSVRLVAAAVVLLVLAYPFTATVDAGRTFFGRGTRVHVAAAVGAALLVGLVWSLLLRLAVRVRLALPMVLLAAGYFTALVGAGLRVQDQYALCWRVQQEAWTQIVSLAPDLGPQTTVLVERVGAARSREIAPWNWATHMVLWRLYEFPADWPRWPQVVPIFRGWEAKLRAGRPLRSVVELPYYQKLPEDAQYILLRERDGRLVRVERPIPGIDEFAALGPAPPGAEVPYRRRLLYRYLILERPATSAP